MSGRARTLTIHEEQILEVMRRHMPLEDHEGQITGCYCTDKNTYADFRDWDGYVEHIAVEISKLEIKP
jgi:hypothetical protein